MTATIEPPGTPAEVPPLEGLARAEGVELLGALHGSGYKDGAALVRRGDGQMVQLGPLMYGLLECADGQRGVAALSSAMSENLGRRIEPEHVQRLAAKLAEQGLLAGSEHRAPPKRNPLLALRWKVLITKPQLTRRLTAPFTVLFAPWVMWPVLACFVGVFWFVLIEKGVASATAQAFHSPGLLLLVFALAVASAGFHELGHAAACRYGGATPGGMGMGLYLVWPAFYTDVTDSYRLPKRDRLRVDLGGLYFNALVAVLTMGAWLVWRVDALLLLVALQVLQMVKQLSPVIRADGYHILSDATGVPDLYSHIGPTMRRLLPGHRDEPTALTGWARVLVTAWVLVIVPVLLSLMLGAVLLLPKLATSAWDSGQHLVGALPDQASHGQVLDLLASVVRLLALALPVLGSALVTNRFLRTVGGKARSWSRGRPARHAVVLTAAAAAIAGIAWAWWPAGQYQPVRPNEGGTLASFVRLVSAPQTAVRPAVATAPQPLAPGAARARLTPGTHLAVSMIPVGGATKAHPALFVIPGKPGQPAVAILSASSPNPSANTGPQTAPSSGGGGAAAGSGAGSSVASGSTTTSSTGGSGGSATTASAFPFALPARPHPGDTQALAVGTKAGAVTYDVAYSLVTVKGGAPVTQTNSAYALAHCTACTTVAVSFQVVLVVGQSKEIAPINAAIALNYDCPACLTTAIADQLVVTLTARPSKTLLSELNAALAKLKVLPALGASGTPAAVASQVAAVQQQVQTQLQNSGLEANPPSSTTTATTGSAATTTPGSSGAAQTTSTPAQTTSSSSQSSTTTSSSSQTQSSTTANSTTTGASSSTSSSTTAPPGG